jgi:hypothetical protein
VAAVEALGGIRDCTGLRLLSSLLEGQDERLSEAAHKALVSITLQDLGSSERKWNAWIEANQNLHRVQWLIEGLMHSEESIRAAAGSEIAYLTQQYFGYQASSPKRDRERIQQRYRDWWKANQPA